MSSSVTDTLKSIDNKIKWLKNSVENDRSESYTAYLIYKLEKTRRELLNGTQR